MIAKPGPILAHAVDVAGTQVGVREVSANWGGAIIRYLQAVGLREPAPWCAAFVVWCVDEAARGMGAPLPVGWPPKGAAYTPSLCVWCRAHGWTVQPWAQARRGDLVFFHWPSLGRIGHVGLVRGAEDGSLLTIEGNGNAAGGREGVAVVRKVRPLSALDKRSRIVRLPF